MKVFLTVDIGTPFIRVSAECPFCLSHCLALYMPDGTVTEKRDFCKHFVNMRPSQNEALFRSNKDIMRYERKMRTRGKHN